MKAIYFIEKDGVKHYKCDTFWSKSKNITDAKIHDDSRVDDFLKSLTSGYIVDGGTLINGSIYGYQTFHESQLDNPYKLKEDPQILQTHYIKIIFVKEGKFEVVDYKEIIRGQKIDQIIDSDIE